MTATLFALNLMINIVLIDPHSPLFLLFQNNDQTPPGIRPQ